MARKKEIDVTKLNYILYARKSTEDKGSQEHSIDDQIKDCKALAKREGLHIRKIVREEKSAKAPNNRPAFNEMLEEIKAGRYDGIIAWHPDRLSRNSLEAGIIMDLFDKEIIKDMKFPFCRFENDSSGKLMLNILFALAKQYSEHIAEGVLRANDNRLPEGKSSGAPKWGYNRNLNGFYEPDDNFDLVRKGWEMKLDGKGNKEILKFWLQSGMEKKTKITRKNKKQRIIKPNINTPTKVFEDSFYYGVLVQAEQEVDLRLVVNDFKPMVTEEEYNQVQAIIAANPHGKTGKTSKKNRATFYPLRSMVRCGVCGSVMYPGASKSRNGERYLYYRCDNKHCAREARSVRAKVIFDEIYRALDSLSFSEREYKIYSKRIEKLSDEELIRLRTERRSLQGRHSNISANISRITNEVLPNLQESNKKAREIEQNKLAGLETDLVEIEERLKVLDDKIDRAKEVIVSKDEFLNLLKSLPQQMRNSSVAEKDAIARICILNLKIDNEKRPHFLWKEPFATLLEGKEFTVGARYET